MYWLIALSPIFFVLTTTLITCIWKYLIAKGKNNGIKD